MSSLRIEALPQEVAAQMKSAVVINQLSDVVLGLLQNSLDANATKIAISVNLRHGDCTVEDNGFGIPSEEFQADGKMGRLFCSSKSHEKYTHGNEGNFISSLAALSSLTITSRCGTDAQRNSILLHRSKGISHELAQYEQYDPIGPAQGTKIVVRNLFGNMPVRVKHRAASVETDVNEMEWRSMVLNITSLILAWNKPISISFQDEESNHRINIIDRISQQHIQDAPAAHSRPSLDSRLALTILTQTSLIEPESRSSFIPVSAATNIFRIKGIISTEPSPTKQKQFISLGIEPLRRSGSQNELFEAVNRIFANSDFGTNVHSPNRDNEEQDKHGNDLLAVKDRIAHQQLREQRKGIDRWPMFFFRIVADAHDEARSWSRVATAEARTILPGVVEALEAMAMQWLVRQKFRPRNIEKRSERLQGNEQAQHVSRKLFRTQEPTSTSFKGVSQLSNNADSSDSIRKKRDVQTRLDRSGISISEHISNSQPFSTLLRTNTAEVSRSQCFDTWSRMKSSNRMSTPATITPISKPDELRLKPKSDTLASHSPQNATPSGFLVAHHSAIHETELRWQDPVTKEFHLVAERSGTILPDPEASPGNMSHLGNITAAAMNDQGHSHATNRTTWITDLFTTWTNPVFRPSESKIPQIRFDFPTDNEWPAEHALDNCRHYKYLSDNAALEHVASRPSNLSTEGLKNADIVSQLDAKFILVKVPVFSEIKQPDNTNKTARQILALIDQHAADERCKVERLFEEICSIEQLSDDSLGHGLQGKRHITELQKPIVFTSPTEEGILLQRHASALAKWGIAYEVIDMRHNTPTTKKCTHRVKVRTLPSVIAERCIAEPHLLMDLIRAEAWERSETLASNPPPRTSTNKGGAHNWLRQIGDCPQGVVALLNSRACRSAIMFNDVLSKIQCETLVSRLANTSFPFQCAHGRPSMVPLLEIENDENAEGTGLESTELQYSADDRNTEQASFVDQFKLWQAQMAKHNHNVIRSELAETD